ILLASLYDAKGDLEKAIQLLDNNYAGVLRYESTLPNLSNLSVPRPPAPGVPFADYRRLAQLRDNHTLFVHLKLKPEIVSKFPELLQVDTSDSSHVPKQ